MILKDAKDLAREFDGLETGCRIGILSLTGRASIWFCMFGIRTITLSKRLPLLNPEPEVRKRILHEIAHAWLGGSRSRQSLESKARGSLQRLSLACDRSVVAPSTKMGSGMPGLQACGRETPVGGSLRAKVQWWSFNSSITIALERSPIIKSLPSVLARDVSPSR